VRGERVRACRLKYYVPSFSAISARVLFLFLPSIFLPFYVRLTVPVGFGALEFIRSKSNRLPFRIQETLLEHGIVLRFSPSLRWTDSLPESSQRDFTRLWAAGSAIIVVYHDGRFTSMIRRRNPLPMPPLFPNIALDRIKGVVLLWRMIRFVIKGLLIVVCYPFGNLTFKAPK
jgi:hypothetical protein